jgi:hypothetical protein
MLTCRRELFQNGDIPELRDSSKRTVGTVVYPWLLLPSFGYRGFDVLNTVGHFPLYVVLCELYCLSFVFSMIQWFPHSGTLTMCGM